MSRLLSVVGYISPSERTHIKGHMGKSVQWMMKNTILGTALASELDARGDVQPYTVSSLYQINTVRPLQGTLLPSQIAWFRVTGIGGTPLGDRVIDALDQWRSHPPSDLELDRMSWILRAIFTTPDQHPWASEISYGDLQDRFRQRTRLHSLSFRFISPTTFHSESLHVPLPVPALLYRKLADGWGKLTPIPLDEHLPLFAQQFLEIESCQMNTHSILVKNEPFVGFTGSASFHLTRVNEGLERRQPDVYHDIQRKRDSLEQWLALLAEFAFYCGVGAKSASGMGMAAAQAKWV
ncbi:MAG: CRISPR system precrRNA processing endoribonuclease RAMP protein Cas6 [Anaerolineae bacterium]|nr:CRISPR system precrRNA processing endoribonuclease RAMP protein Cas6 [Anaerolineae bacterium]